MKRTFQQYDSIANFTRSKKPKLCPPLEYIPTKSWVSATHIRNYIVKDPIIDWLEIHNNKFKEETKNETKNVNDSLSNMDDHNNTNDFTSFIMQKGNEFEKELINYINEKKITVQTVSDVITKESISKTIEYIRQGVPIIHSAPLQNNRAKTRGIADLLVRSDYIERLVNICPLSDSEKCIKAPKLNGNYHYVVIDVKFSTLPLRADGKHLLNSGSFQFYKAQTWIYTQALGIIQGYTPRYAFILGRRWNYTSKGIKYNSIDCLDKLGVIDFYGVDNQYIKRTQKAINWRRKVRKYGSTWSVFPPTRKELYPNMCIDGKWSKQKQYIADVNKEITTIWNCGVKERENAMKQGVTSWSDPRCNSETLSLGPKRAFIIDSILNINRQQQDIIRPSVITNNSYNWRYEQIGNEDVFVDFETLLDIFSPMSELPLQKSSTQIFMIGVYYKDNNQYTYKNFICKELTATEEYRIMNEFYDFMRDRNFPKMWYWHAEKSFWTQAENRQYDNLGKVPGNSQKLNVILKRWCNLLNSWCDLKALFQAEPIVIKDCFNYGLKNIVKAMHKHKLINCQLESKCDSGTTAAVKAWEAYKDTTDIANNSVIKDIATYNEFDVKSLHLILNYLRNNH